jgi:hypothetical protein
VLPQHNRGGCVTKNLRDHHEVLTTSTALKNTTAVTDKHPQ